MADLELGDALKEPVPEIEPEIKRDFISSLEAEPYDDEIGETCDKTDYVPLLDDDETEPKTKLADGGHAEPVVANGEHGTGDIGVSDPFGPKLDEDVLVDILLPPDDVQIFSPLQDTEPLPAMSEPCLLDFNDSSDFFSPLQREPQIQAEAAQSAFDEGWLTDSYSKTGDTDTQSGDASEKTTATFGETPSDDSTNVSFQVTKSDHLSDIWQPTAEEQLALSSHNPSEHGDLHSLKSEDFLFDAPVSDSQAATESQLLPGLANQQLQDPETGYLGYEESDEAPEYLSVDAQNFETENSSFLDQNTISQEQEGYLSQAVGTPEESSCYIEDSPPSSESCVPGSAEDIIAYEETAPVQQNEPFAETIEKEQVLSDYQTSQKATPVAHTQEEIPTPTAVLPEAELLVSTAIQLQEKSSADCTQESFSNSPTSLVAQIELPATQAEVESPISPAPRAPSPSAQAETVPPSTCVEVKSPAKPETLPLACPFAEAEIEPFFPVQAPEEPPASPVIQAPEEPPASPVIQAPEEPPILEYCSSHWDTILLPLLLPIHAPSD
ncbi:uncharacterized protein [Pyxicephalus adspersus]|uniref:uncharacterized protein n=1 Tax=Pyxicephalus adspersus TaxID=30357 RepID=UPI003B59E2DF